MKTPEELNATTPAFMDTPVSPSATVRREGDSLIPVTPDSPPWGIPGAAITWIGSVVFLFVVQSAAVVAYAFYMRVPLVALPKFLTEDTRAIFVSIVSIIPAHLLTLLVVWAVATRFGKYSFAAGMGWGWARGFNLWTSSLLALVLLGVGIGLTKLLGGQETPLDQMLARSVWARYAVAFLATFTAPLVEELVYRGIIYPAVKRPIARLRDAVDRASIVNNVGPVKAFALLVRHWINTLLAEYGLLAVLMAPVLAIVIPLLFLFYMLELAFSRLANKFFADVDDLARPAGALPPQYGVVGAIFAVMLLFTIIHVPQYWGNLGVIATIALLSFFLTLVRAYTRRTLPSVVIHTVFNGIQSVLIVAAAYRETLPIEPTAPHGFFFLHSLPLIGLFF